MNWWIRNEHWWCRLLFFSIFIDCAQTTKEICHINYVWFPYWKLMNSRGQTDGRVRFLPLNLLVNVYVRQLKAIISAVVGKHFSIAAFYSEMPLSTLFNAVNIGRCWRCRRSHFSPTQKKKNIKTLHWINESSNTKRKLKKHVYTSYIFI